jgi:DNA-binding transcriptional MocR family regulator
LHDLAALQHFAAGFQTDRLIFCSGAEEMMRHVPMDESSDSRTGCGPLIPPLSDTLRPLRQQIFERVRAAGLIPRVQVAKDLGVSPASVTTITSELIDAGLIEEIAAPRDGDQGRGRPAVALGVRADAYRVAGMKLSDREHTAVIVDFAGNLIADDVIPRRPGALGVAELLAAYESLPATCGADGLHEKASRGSAG